MEKVLINLTDIYTDTPRMIEIEEVIDPSKQKSFISFG